MHKILSCLLLFSFAINSSFGQQHHYNWKIGVHAGIANYYGDLSHQIWDLPHQFKQPIQDFNFLTYGLSLEYHVSKTFGLRLLGLKSQFKASDRTYTNSLTYNRALNVQTDIIDASLLAVVYLDNGLVLNPTAAIAPYFLFGGGLTHFESRGDLLSANNERYYYWSDQSIRNQDEQGANASTAQIIHPDYQYETALRPLKTEGRTYQPFTWNIALGIGAKFRLSKRFHLHLEALIRYTGTDYLDDVSANYLPNYTDNFQAYAANPSAINRSQRGDSPKMNDWYSFVGLSINYSFGQKTYAIRPAIIYTADLLKETTTVTTNSTIKDIHVPIEENNANNPINPASIPSLPKEDSLKTDSLVSPKIDNIALETPPSTVDSNSLDSNQLILPIATPIQPDSVVLKDTLKQQAAPFGERFYIDKIHQLELKQQQQQYDYELKLQQQHYEGKLMEQKLLNELKSEQERPIPSTQQHQLELQQQKFDAELKRQQQQYEYQLKLQELQNALKIERLKKGKDTVSFIVPSSSSPVQVEQVTQSISRPIVHSNKSIHKPPLESSVEISHQSQTPDQQQSTKPATTLSQPSEKIEPSPKPSVFSTSVAQDLAQMQAERDLLLLKIKALENQNQTAPSKDTIRVLQRDSIFITNDNHTVLADQLNQQQTRNQDLAVQLELLHKKKRAQEHTIDSLNKLLAQVETEKRMVSGELEAFLSQKKATYVTKIYFDVGKSSLTVQAKETLTTLIYYLKKYPTIRFWVKGFASKTGNKTTNERLSAERALAVANFIKQTGVHSDRIKTTPLGEQNSQDNHELDRRAEVHLSF
ncbi:OmpA family protein [Aureispira anguillae]|uniref:OmpA family protein n=1 Tax=Aureispira anguillae TaxID=2864201 RepID=A0A915YLR1_9BACT|nr:OmpA family protein [Aureispira anguillae]BDS15560.1 OmpA family protein [Aureispira anguillae]